MTPCQKLLKQEGTARRIESMQQSSATPSLHLWFLGVAEDCCMLSILLAVPSCFNSFWHGVIPTSYFIFNDFYTCTIYKGLTQLVALPIATMLDYIPSRESTNHDTFLSQYFVEYLEPRHY